MRITDVPFAVLRFQYDIARFPLQLIEEQLAARLGSEAPARLFYERSLGVLDTTVGTALGDPELAKRGAALTERSDARGRAAKLDATATETQQQADIELKDKRDRAIQDQKDARAAREAEIQEARIQAEERKRAAEKAAAKRTAAAKQQADEVADRRKEAAEAAKREEEAKITAAEQNATATAESKLKNAEQKRSDTANKRAQADQIEELADAEKQKRRADPANNA